eukprot:1548616-Prymnesium_polylepis.2
MSQVSHALRMATPTDSAGFCGLFRTVTRLKGVDQSDVLQIFTLTSVKLHLAHGCQRCELDAKAEAKMAVVPQEIIDRKLGPVVGAWSSMTVNGLELRTAVS